MIYLTNQYYVVVEVDDDVELDVTKIIDCVMHKSLNAARKFAADVCNEHSHLKSKSWKRENDYFNVSKTERGYLIFETAEGWYEYQGNVNGVLREIETRINDFTYMDYVTNKSGYYFTVPEGYLLDSLCGDLLMHKSLTEMYRYVINLQGLTDLEEVEGCEWTFKMKDGEFTSFDDRGCGEVLDTRPEFYIRDFVL